MRSDRITDKLRALLSINKQLQILDYRACLLLLAALTGLYTCLCLCTYYMHLNHPGETRPLRWWTGLPAGWASRCQGRRPHLLIPPLSLSLPLLLLLLGRRRPLAALPLAGGALTLLLSSAEDGWPGQLFCFCSPQGKGPPAYKEEEEEEGDHKASLLLQLRRYQLRRRTPTKTTGSPTDKPAPTSLALTPPYTSHLPSQAPPLATPTRRGRGWCWPRAQGRRTGPPPPPGRGYLVAEGPPGRQCLHLLVVGALPTPPVHSPIVLGAEDADRPADGHGEEAVAFLLVVHRVVKGRGGAAGGAHPAAPAPARGCHGGLLGGAAALFARVGFGFGDEEPGSVDAGGLRRRREARE